MSMAPGDKEKKLGVGEKIAFGLGNMNNLLMNNILNVLLNPIYNIALGVSPALIGYAAAIPRLWDAVSDPLVGFLSDNFRSRWGRRKPFMLIGAIISALSLMAIWWVPSFWGEQSMFFYLVVMSLIFYTGNTFFLVPYGGLGLALSDDYHERTNLFAYKAVVDALGGFLLPWIYWLTTRSCFENTLQGARVLGFGMGLWILVFTVIPIAFCRERYDAKVARQEKIPLWRSIRETVQNKPFLLLTFAVTLMFFGFYASSAICSYLNIFYIFNGVEKEASVYVGLSGTLWKISSLVSLPIVVFISRKLEKRTVFLIAMILAFSGSISSWWCINPNYPALQLIPSVLNGPGISCVLMLCESMLADVCDLDEVANGSRREAMFSAIYGWFSKVGLTLALALSGLLLVWCGFDIALGAAQTAGTILAMRILAAVVPASGMFVAIVLIAFYPLNERRMQEVRKTLNSRDEQDS
ncbi:MFS transporter [uncultured Victivallis sp.]|uniref:MFS transporter n=1 Tax=uncultured Victivallis sp. TaxID=354118 RepID=UPI0025F39638|nr:MFS transporter [uncultured Victivallis sp.]